MKKIILLTLLMTLCSLNYAQKAPIKFGNINLEDLTKTQYDIDTTAAAIILCKYGYYDKQKHQFTQNIRIKILKKQGIAWGTHHTYPSSHKGMLKGITFNYENGEVIKDKLKNQDIYIEKSNNYFYNMRPAMPNVKVGSIVDIEYTGPGYPISWYFQELIPVLHSELIMEKSDYYNFRKTQTGAIALDVVEDGRWVAKNVPAFKKEPYMNSYKNYISKFNIDILDYGVTNYVSVTRDWNDISRFFHQVVKYDVSLDSDNSYNSEAKSILENTTDVEEQVRQAYNIIQNIKFNGTASPVLSNPIRSIKSLQSGTTADINFSLISLLRKMDFQAFPVVISTRNNGVLTKPSLFQINSVIVYASKEGHNYLMDASEKYMPYNLLPEKDLNWNSQVIVSEEKCIPFKVEPIKKDETYRTYQLTLDDEDCFTGVVQCQKKDYAAYHFRKTLGKYGSQEEYINYLTSSHSGLRVKSYEVYNIDAYEKPTKENYTVSFNSAVNKLGDKIIFNPLFMEQVKDNPFKNETRISPIDFVEPIVKTAILNITLPDGYTIEEVPESTARALANNKAAFRYSVTPMGKQIQIQYEFAINQPLFGINEYADLKAFYNELITSHAKPIVLKKM